MTLELDSLIRGTLGEGHEVALAHLNRSDSCSLNYEEERCRIILLMKNLMEKKKEEVELEGKLNPAKEHTSNGTVTADEKEEEMKSPRDSAKLV